MNVFIVNYRHRFAECAAYAYIIPAFGKVGIIIGIMNAPDINRLIFLAHRHRIAELGYSGRVRGLYKTVQQVEINAAEGFIAERPDDNARMRVIAGNQISKV